MGAANKHRCNPEVSNDESRNPDGAFEICSWRLNWKKQLFGQVESKLMPRRQDDTYLCWVDDLPLRAAMLLKC